MLSFLVNGNSTTVHASGTHLDMLAQAIALEAQLHHFVYRLGSVEYAVFLSETTKLSASNTFFDFLHSKPDEETRITMPNLNRESETDGE